MSKATSAVTPAATIITRPTTKSEWTLIGAGIACVVLVLVFGAVLTFGSWQAALDGLIIHYLGWALLLLVFGILLVVAACISPSVGTIRASGMGANLEIKGLPDA